MEHGVAPMYSIHWPMSFWTMFLFVDIFFLILLFVPLFFCFKYLFLLFVLQSPSHRRLWGPVKRLESLYPDSNPQGNYAGEFNVSSFCYAVISIAWKITGFCTGVFDIEFSADQTCDLFWGCLSAKVSWVLIPNFNKTGHL